MSIDMFDFEWYRTKNKSKELTLGWLYNNGIQNDFAKGYTKNVTDYLSVEWSFYFEKQFASDTIEDLCKQAYDNGFSKILVFKQGLYTKWNFEDEFAKFYEANTDIKFVGHVLDNVDSYYRIHPQTFMLDLNWWADAGFPEWGEQKWHDSFETIEPIRSKENHHDEYTPHWIAPSENLKNYKHKLEGWNLVKTLMEDGQKVISWPKEIRHQKHYSYPEVEYDGPRHLAGALEITQTEGFFIANTEDLTNMDYLIKERKSNTLPAWDGTFNNIWTPAAGLSPLIWSFKLNLQKGSKIVVYDVSKFALDVTRRIINEWDGTNYSKFAEHLMEDIAPKQDKKIMFRGIDKLKYTDNVVEKLNKDGFKQWLTDVLPTINIIYKEINLLEPQHYKNFTIDIVDGEVGYMHLSNIFHYFPTSFHYSLQQRWELHNELIKKLRDASHNNNLLLTSNRGFTFNRSWIDDWPTSSFKDLEEPIGKLLKWNK